MKIKLHFSIFLLAVVLRQIQGKYMIIHAPMKLSYFNAVNYCRGRFMQLVKIETSIKNDLIHAYSKRNGLGRFWINGNDIAHESFWIDSEGHSLRFKKWDKKEPNGARAENCIEGNRHSGGTWNDEKCSEANSVICEAHKEVHAIVYKGKFIHAPKKLKFAEATKFCVNNNRYLAPVKDATFNAMLFEYAKENKLGLYWVGASDAEHESNWVDSNKRNILFRNWHPKQPDGARKENCAIAGVEGSEAWADVSCLEEYSVIC